ncbi:MAG: prenyltransferase/squalene oxidase repeat-containing protein, partial [Solirubrobacteraceae bacterium]
MARRLCAAALGVCATLLACATGTALATAVNAADRERLDRTARYLQDAQNADGGFSVRVGGPSEPGASAWVALGLAAAGVNPQEQTPLSGGHSVYTYLQEHAQALSSTTAFARELLVVDAAGAAPEDFGGVHLVEEILSRQLEGPGSTGAFAEEAHSSAPSVNGTIFAILALSPIDEEHAAKAVQQAAQWLLTVHNAGAGWPSHEVCPSHASPGGCESNTDMTGAAIEALNAAGLERQPVQEEAFEYLRQYAQSPNGGFSQQAEEAEPNVASTAWVLQGIWSAAENPEAWPWLTEAAGDPMSYLASMQQEDGHIRYDASEEDNGVWMTAQVAPAYAGQPFPIPAVPLKAEPNQPPASSDSAAPGPAGAEAGDGGESAYPGPGVISAGGGDGASLFSRPQPQSQG